MHSDISNWFKSLRCLGLAAVLAIGPVAHLSAADTMAEAPVAAKIHKHYYLTAGKPDATELLAPPPLPNSAEQAADLAETISVHERNTPDQETAAKAEEKFSVFSFTPAVGPFFQSGKFPKTEAFLKHVQEDADATTDAAKNFYKRPRPYVVEPKLARGESDLEKSFGYPSGHSTRGTVIALVMAELFPKEREQILAIGRDIGWHRVELARHYPTDIYAGRVLAGSIFRNLKSNAQFQKDLAEAQQEIAATMLAEAQKQAPATAATR